MPTRLNDNDYSKSNHRYLKFNNNVRKSNKTILSKNICSAVLGGAAIFGSMFSYANETSLGLSVGTAGLGVEVSKALSPSIVTRFYLSGYTFEVDIEEDGIDYTADLSFSNFAAIIDWHPWHNGFHLSSGLVNNGNRFEMSAEQADNYEIGDTTYSGTLSLQATVKFRRVSPYVGFGWNNAATGRDGLAWSTEIGVILQGEPIVKLSATGTNITASGSSNTIDVTSNGDFQDDLKAEQVALQDALDSFEFYPVITFGLHYQF